jgi:hypothetical protein
VIFTLTPNIALTPNIDPEYWGTPNIVADIALRVEFRIGVLKTITQCMIGRSLHRKFGFGQKKAVLDPMRQMGRKAFAIRCKVRGCQP